MIKPGDFLPRYTLEVRKFFCTRNSFDDKEFLDAPPYAFADGSERAGDVFRAEAEGDLAVGMVAMHGLDSSFEGVELALDAGEFFFDLKGFLDVFSLVQELAETVAEGAHVVEFRLEVDPLRGDVFDFDIA